MPMQSRHSDLIPYGVDSLSGIMGFLLVRIAI